MKKLFTIVALALSVWGGASAESLDRELGLLASTRANMSNIATALDMYAQDHDGAYPDSLAALEVNYLRRVPTAIDGSTDWNYRVDGKNFRIGDAWDGFARLGLPTTIVYDSGKGWEPMQLPAELRVIGQEVDLQGEWLRRPGGNLGLSASWERFDARITARLRGRISPSESFAESKQRLAADYLRWGWQTDNGDFARAVPKAIKPGWTLEGIYTVPKEPGQKAILLSRGERLLEVTVEDRQSRDGLGSFAPVKSLLSQL